MADGGTLFLDDLGETTPNVQVNLLRVLQEMTFRRVGGRELVHVDVRIVAATNVHLEQAVREGSFRQDLFYRLNVFPIRLPPLRELREDTLLRMRLLLDEIAGRVWPRATHDLPRRHPGDPSRTSGWQRASAAGHVRAVGDHPRWGPPRARGAAGRDVRASSASGRGGRAARRRARDHEDSCSRVIEQVERAYLFRVLTRCQGHLGRTRRPHRRGRGWYGSRTRRKPPGPATRESAGRASPSPLAAGTRSPR